MEKSLAFYRDLLGMKVRVEPKLYQPDESMDKIFNMKGASFYYAQLDYDDSYVIEILEWVSPRARIPATPNANDLGFHWQCIYQTDVEGTYRRLKAAGVKFVSEPVMLGGGTIPDVFCLDPDGNWVEIHPPRQ